jgi:predicted SAM-dependent methyltransferase
VSLRLNLGSGSKRPPGYVNVDLPGSGADVECDIRALPYADGAADEVLAVHVLEHIPVADVAAVVTEWARVLKTGGRMVLELPCREKVFGFIAQGVTDPRLVLFPLYGDPRTHRTVADVHRWCWSKLEVAMLMRDAGLVDVTSEPPQFHVPMRDMRIVGVKGAD